jgi:predicted Zn-dependent peptidase
LEVLADIYLHPKFAAADIAKERGVIKEELVMYHDQPDHYVHELLTETLWPAQPLGRPLTGSVKSLDATDRAAIVAFKQTKYLAGNTIVAVAGRCRHAEVVAQVAKAFTGVPVGAIPKCAPVTECQRTPQLRFLNKEIEQSHLALAVRGYSRHDPRRYTAKLLSVILGENMSSRLFQVIRERYGLAYAIHASTGFFADTGVFTVSAGLETKRLPRALRLIMRELAKVGQRPPGPSELRRAKDYAVGQMRLGLESTSNQMMWLGEHLLAYGVIPSPDEVERRIEAVTGEDVQRVAADLFRDRRLNAAVISPSRETGAIREWLTFD